MTGMKTIATKSHNKCMNPLTTSCETSKYRLSTRLNSDKPKVVVLDEIEQKCLIIDVAVST